jgi:hypothetical protein
LEFPVGLAGGSRLVRGRRALDGKRCRHAHDTGPSDECSARTCALASVVLRLAHCSPLAFPIAAIFAEDLRRFYRAGSSSDMARQTNQLVLPDGQTIPVNRVADIILQYESSVIDLFDRSNVGPHDQIEAIDLLSLNALMRWGVRLTFPRLWDILLWRARPQHQQRDAAGWSVPNGSSGCA